MSEWNEQVEKYTSHQMSEEERAEFLLRLKDNPELAGEVEVYGKIDEALSNDELRDFVVMLDSVKQEHHSLLEEKSLTLDAGQKEHQPSSLKRWYPIAAVVALVIAASVVFWPSAKINPERWYQDNFKPFPAQSLRSQDERYPEGLSDALLAYRQEQFAKAADMLKPWQTDSLNGHLAMFYRANALMATDSSEAAVKILEHLLTSKETVLTQSVEWYAVLAYVSSNDHNNARKLAQSISSNPQHAYREHAEQLLSDIF